jgi:hypothetical protein
MARRQVIFDEDVVETRRWASAWKPHTIMMGAPEVYSSRRSSDTMVYI